MEEDAPASRLVVCCLGASAKPAPIGGRKRGRMTEAWKQWEGHVVNGEFPLKKYLGGSNQSGVFLTEVRAHEPQPAAIRLVRSDPANAERRLSQWGLAQRLSHPHLLQLLRKGRCRLGDLDFIFLVMEYGEENLAEIFSQRPLTPQEAREMLAPALDALAYLHGQGFVFGRLKPADVMAVKDRLKLASDDLCRAGEAVVDPRKLTVYDPPEQTSEARSPAGDIWSMGMILAEALTQHPPSWNEGSPTDPPLPDNLPAPFFEIVRGCLRRDPRRRWTIAEIKAWLDPTSLKPLEHPAPSRPAKQKPMIRRFAFPATVAILAVAALFMGLGLLRSKPEMGQQDAAAQSAQAPEPSASGTAQSKPRDRQPVASSGLKPSPIGGAQARPASLRSETQAAQINRSPEISGVVHQVLPDVPQTASDTIQGTIRVSVRVNVDPSGNVVGAELDSPGPSKYFARMALAAAQNWKFAAQDQDVVREFIVHFEFRNTGPRAYATSTAS